MNVLLWVVQVLLALLAIPGGAYKMLASGELASMSYASALPRAGWIALGVFEVVCGLLLIIPIAKGRFIPLAAGALAIESIALAILYARHSTALTAQNPLVWVVLMAIEATFIAIARRRGQVES